MLSNMKEKRLKETEVLANHDQDVKATSLTCEHETTMACGLSQLLFMEHTCNDSSCSSLHILDLMTFYKFANLKSGCPTILSC